MINSLIIVIKIKNNLIIKKVTKNIKNIEIIKKINNSVIIIT